MGPSDSTAMGWKIYCVSRFAYLAVLRSAADSAADPTLLAAASIYEVATGQTTVTSHVRGLPPARLISHSIGAFAISSGYSARFFGNWNASRDKRVSCQIVQGVVSSCAPRPLLEDETVNPMGINQ